MYIRYVWGGVQI